jgi:hypothetical protein
VAGPSYTHAELEELWILAGGSEATADTAAAIAEAESGGCQYALAGPVDIRPVKTCTWTVTNGENSCGLWQINLRAHPTYSAPGIFDTLTNAGAAVAISDGGADFTPWTTYVSGAYKTHLQSGGTPTAQPGTVTQPEGTPVLTHAHSGWGDLRQVVNHHLPNRIEQSRVAGLATLRTLRARHRVKG